MLPITPLDRRQLRYFGIALASLFWVLAVLAVWRWQATGIAGFFAVAGILVAAVYYLRPASQQPIYLWFRRVTYPIQLLVTVVLLAGVYFLLITPIGALLRLRGISVRRKPDPHQPTYWSPLEHSGDVSRYFDTY